MKARKCLIHSFHTLLGFELSVAQLRRLAPISKTEKLSLRLCEGDTYSIQGSKNKHKLCISHAKAMHKLQDGRIEWNEKCDQGEASAGKRRKKDEGSWMDSRVRNGTKTDRTKEETT